MNSSMALETEHPLFPGKDGFVSKRVLWKFKCCSGLQTVLGEIRALIGIYDPKGTLLISVGKYIWNRGLWKGGCHSNCGCVFVLAGGGVGGEI
jgi:hypothetical protein